MSTSDLLVIGAGIAVSGFLAPFLFGPKKARRAELVGQVQEVHVTLEGGYLPDVIRVRQSVPLRMVFDRQESGDCTSRTQTSRSATHCPPSPAPLSSNRATPSRRPVPVVTLASRGCDGGTFKLRSGLGLELSVVRTQPRPGR